MKHLNSMLKPRYALVTSCVVDIGHGYEYCTPASIIHSTFINYNLYDNSDSLSGRWSFIKLGNCHLCNYKRSAYENNHNSRCRLPYFKFIKSFKDLLQFGKIHLKRIIFF